VISLTSAYKSFERRSQLFLDMTSRAPSLKGKARDHSVAHVVIELQTSLGFVARSAYLAGTVGGWRANGTKMPRRFANATDALMAAAQVVKKKPVSVPGRDEPSWHSSDHMVRVAASVAPSNSAAFTSATSAFPDVLATMICSRNFYAHRGAHTREEVERALATRFALVANGHLTDLLLSTHGGGAPLLEVWIWNYLDVADLLCER
jgi:hypothetical protein